jgi:AAA+ superfamily predicted ATPase
VPLVRQRETLTPLVHVSLQLIGEHERDDGNGTRELWERVAKTRISLVVRKLDAMSAL